MLSCVTLPWRCLGDMAEWLLIGAWVTQGQCLTGKATSRVCDGSGRLFLWCSLHNFKAAWLVEESPLKSLLLQ